MLEFLSTTKELVFLFYDYRMHKVAQGVIVV